MAIQEHHTQRGINRVNNESNIIADSVHQNDIKKEEVISATCRYSKFVELGGIQ